MITTHGLGGQNIVTDGFGYRIYADSGLSPVVEVGNKWGAYRWGTFQWTDPVITWMVSQSSPSTIFSLETKPGRGASSDGAYTDSSEDGAWTEPPLAGAYTQDGAYEKEFIPSSSFTKEGKPTT